MSGFTLMTALATTSTLFVTAPFNAGEPIPVKYTCSGDDLSPRLSWTAGPAGTKSYALVAEDPDAPGETFVHWVLFDFTPGTENPVLPEGLPKTRTGSLEAQAVGGSAHAPLRQGTNGFGKLGWGGPCPPPGPAHHYHFRVFALDAVLGLPPGASASAVKRAMAGHVLATGEAIGTFAR